MANTTDTKVINYVAKNLDVLRKIGQITNANKKMAISLGKDFGVSIKSVEQGIGKISKKTWIDKKNLNFGIEKTKQFSKVIKTADGRLQKFTETTKTNSKGIKSTSRSLKDMSNNTVSLAENMKRLASRAALTIPLWLALRGAVMGVINIFKNGINDIVSFDKVLQKLGKNLQGTPQQIKAGFAKAKEEITKFSLESGASVEDITNAVQKFATVGFDLETSLSAGINATKLSIVLFGDATETANAFARSMNVLMDRTKGAKTEQVQMAEAMALTSEMWETLPFEVNEFSSGLEKIAGTAKAVGLSFKEIGPIMAAFSAQGLSPKRSRVMKTALLKMVGQLDEVARTLDVNVNPKLDNTFVMFQKVGKALSELDFEEKAQAVAKLFGVRSGEAWLDYAAGFDKVSESLDKFAKAQPDLTRFEDGYQKINASLHRQVEQFKNLKKESGKAFVTGLVGADNFEEAMRNINDAMRNIQASSETLGKAFSSMFSGGFNTDSAKAMKEVFDYIYDVDVSDNPGERLLKSFTGPIKATGGVFADAWSKSVIEPAMKKSEEDFDKVLKALHGKLKKMDAEQLLIDIETGEIKVDQANIERVKQRIEETLNEDPIQVAVEPSSEDRDRRLEGNRQSLAEELVSSELQTLKVLGASNVQLLKAEQAYISKLNLSREDEVLLRKKLELERAINEEKKQQTSLSSDSMKLAKIGQEDGTHVARRINQFLEGEISFDVFKAMGGKSFDRFKSDFSSKYEQESATKYLSGRGRGIGVDEVKSSLSNAEMNQSLARINQQAIKYNVQSNVEINAKIDPTNIQSFYEEAGRQFAQQLKLKGTSINDALNEGIDKSKLRRDL